MINSDQYASSLIKIGRTVAPINFEIPDGILNKFNFEDNRFFVTFTNYE